MDELTVSEQQLWEHYKAIESENYHLKNQLQRKNKQVRTLKAEYASLLSKYKKLTDNKKPKYNNGRKNK